MPKKNYDKLDYFKILEVSQDSTEEEIRQKYRELAKYWHPDHNDKPNAIEMFQKISVAYDILKDAKTRLKYILLSIIYDKSCFPDMNSLCLIRNMHSQEDLNLRAFHLIEITGKGIGHSSIDKLYYCNPYEAVNVVRSITKHNWLHGFWGLTAFFANANAIVQNILRINDKRDNLQLLLHNAIVYGESGKIAEAATLATLAKDYADKDERNYIDMYLEGLNCSSLLGIQKWNFNQLIKIQLIYPAILLISVLVCLALWGLVILKQNNQNSGGVKQVVVFENGQKIYSDVAVAKIFDIPVDVYDKQKLYHVTKRTNAMHGADKSFDVYKVVEEDTTVRITGYTADKKWLRVMFDNGEMAFIEADYLKQGIGNEIPLWSKIYKEE